MHSWVAICRDKDSVSVYHFTCSQTCKERARAHFERLVLLNGWKPFDEIEVAQVSISPERNALKKIASIIL